MTLKFEELRSTSVVEHTILIKDCKNILPELFAMELAAVSKVPSLLLDIVLYK